VALSPDLTLPQVRGMEGVRVREAYARASREYGVAWSGRRYDRSEWGRSDPINRALSAANALLNGLCHAAIVSGGYSPGLGFIHTGKQLCGRSVQGRYHHPGGLPGHGRGAAARGARGAPVVPREDARDAAVGPGAARHRPAIASGADTADPALPGPYWSPGEAEEGQPWSS